jgi:DNA-binding transcriptional LysR family regulator
MEIEKYEALLCAIEKGSFSAAAEALGYTPSGISRMMAALELENGFPLLIRRKEGVVPTKECIKLMPQIREIVFEGEKLKQMSAQIRNVETGTLTIGTAYSAYYGWLSEVTSKFHKQYPGVEIKIVSGYSAELVEQMEKHEVDMAIISERSGNHQWIPLIKDRLLAMVSVNHPVAKLNPVPIELFASESYIDTYPGKDIDNAYVFKRCHVTPNTQFSTMDIYATYSMVEAGLGISMNNEINCRNLTGSIKTIPLNPPQTTVIGLAVAKDKTPAAASFMKFSEAYMDELKNI